MPGLPPLVLVPMFAALWTVNTTAPFEPLAVAVSAGQSLVAVSACNCPDNTESRLTLHDLANGRVLSSKAGISQMALATDTKRPVVAGVGWNKEKSTTTFAVSAGRALNDPGLYEKTLGGEPAYGIPVAITADGQLSAFLYEPNPDAGHINNRSGILHLVNASSHICYSISSRTMVREPPTHRRWHSVRTHTGKMRFIPSPPSWATRLWWWTTATGRRMGWW